MRVAILEQPQSRIPVRDLEVQQPSQGEVLLDMVAAGVCHSDYHLIGGHMQPWGLPWVLGHEGAGVIREVGPGVSGVAPGDKIILSLDAMCGYCRKLLAWKSRSVRDVPASARHPHDAGRKTDLPLSAYLR